MFHPFRFVLRTTFPICLLLLCSVLGFSQSWTEALTFTGSYYGSSFRDVIATTRGDLLLAARQGLYRSTDDGKTWRVEAIIPRPMEAHSLLCSHDALFVGLESGVYRMPDGGGRGSWQKTMLPEYAYHILTEGPDGSIYALANTEGLYRSDDGGVHWKALDVAASILSPAERKEIRQFAIAADGTLFLAGRSDVLVRSDDRGASWRGVRFYRQANQSGRVARRDSQRHRSQSLATRS